VAGGQRLLVEASSDGDRTAWLTALAAVVHRDPADTQPEIPTFKPIKVVDEGQDMNVDEDDALTTPRALGAVSAEPSGAKAGEWAGMERYAPPPNVAALARARQSRLAATEDPSIKVSAMSIKEFGA
jgi:hypothetical protein